MYPSASFVRSYEPVMVVLKTGAVHTGVLKSEDRNEVVLTTSPTTEMRLARSEVADIRPSPVSIMPAGYGDQLTRQELADQATQERLAQTSLGTALWGRRQRPVGCFPFPSTLSLAPLSPAFFSPTTTSRSSSTDWT